MQDKYTSGNKDLEKVGVRILMVREAKNLSNEELSRKSGLDGNLLSRIEQGLEDISFLAFLDLSAALEISPSQLLKIDD